uniref:NADH-ubiquinone oxidoreductase chain 5 n=1 Tax=Donax variegatus TaxID=1920007 RepID=A0A250E5X2_9BIVA|nr:NADH dehydrogenase subunit 5 [Donax variegatus]ATA66415.1 NADH dehydrogenase subunit 5 [Donax variegatus]
MSFTMNVYYFYSVLLSFLLCWVFVVMNFMLSGEVLVVELDLLGSSALNMNIPFVIDVYSLLFCLIVLMISSSVMLYNGFYMDSEVFYARFCKLVLLFVLSMLFLVFIPNLLGLMVGWDGLGLTSYLLVIYYQDKKSLGSGTLTVLSNRVGDVLFFMGISLASGVSTWGFVDLTESVVVGVFCGVVVVGCMTKSAQLPFSAWLPAAMAAPSPVSALVHSSTLVTAGVYVLIRFSGCINSNWFLFLGLISSMTMIMAAMSAVYEPDVKKVVALSTLSQLGVMMLAISVGSIGACFFHLVSHALFKALMFLCVGAIIHYSGIQDLRYLGGFVYKNPIVCSWLVVACLSLMGFPFLAGFYSKDLVLEAFLSVGVNYLLLTLVILSTCLTAFYSLLMLVSVMSGACGSPFLGDMKSNLYVLIPCFILGVGALFGGVVMQSLVLDFNMSFSLQGLVKVVPITCVTTGVVAILAYVSYSSESRYGVEAPTKGVSVGLSEFFISKMWFLPLLSSDLFIPKALSSSGLMKSDMEDGYIESLIGGEGVWNTIAGSSVSYMSSQMEVLGIAFIKGFFFFLFMLSVVKL